MTGDRPRPCSDFTFTAVDDCRAVYFAGKQPSGKVNDAFILDHRLMVRHKNILVAFNLTSILVVLVTNVCFPAHCHR